MAKEGVVLEYEADFAVADPARGHVFLVEQDGAAAAVGAFQAGDDSQKRGLAGAGRAEQGHEFAGGHGETDVIEGDEGAECFGDISGFDAHFQSPT